MLTRARGPKPPARPTRAMTPPGQSLGRDGAVKRGPTMTDEDQQHPTKNQVRRYVIAPDLVGDRRVDLYALFCGALTSTGIIAGTVPKPSANFVDDSPQVV